MADSKEGLDGVWQADTSVACFQGLLLEVESIGFYAPESNASLPYQQSRTALAAEKITCDTICQLR
jgi:hypothetical protein